MDHSKIKAFAIVALLMCVSGTVWSKDLLDDGATNIECAYSIWRFSYVLQGDTLVEYAPVQGKIEYERQSIDNKWLVFTGRYTRTLKEFARPSNWSEQVFSQNAVAKYLVRLTLDRVDLEIVRKESLIGYAMNDRQYDVVEFAKEYYRPLLLAEEARKRTQIISEISRKATSGATEQLKCEIKEKQL